MASTFSFDIESSFDASELDHAIDQTRRELENRYDFKGTSAAIDYTDSNRKGVTVVGDTEYQLEAIVDVLRQKLAKRNISQKLLDTSGKPQQRSMALEWILPFQQGLDQEKAKQVSKLIRDQLPKVKSQIQGETVRVTSQKKDELQTAMQVIREADLPFPTNFTNFR